MNDQHLRLSDAERESAAAALGEHFAQGRLSLEEHAERLDRVWAARTRGELGPVFRDLPGRYGPPAPPVAAPSRRPAYPARGAPPVRRGMSPVLVVLVVLLALTLATHLPLLLVGVLLWCFATRHRTRSAAHHWSR